MSPSRRGVNNYIFPNRNKKCTQLHAPALPCQRQSGHTSSSQAAQPRPRRWLRVQQPPSGEGARGRSEPTTARHDHPLPNPCCDAATPLPPLAGPLLLAERFLTRMRARVLKAARRSSHRSAQPREMDRQRRRRRMLLPQTVQPHPAWSQSASRRRQLPSNGQKELNRTGLRDVWASTATRNGNNGIS